MCGRAADRVTGWTAKTIKHTSAGKTVSPGKRRAGGVRACYYVSASVTTASLLRSTRDAAAGEEVRSRARERTGCGGGRCARRCDGDGRTAEKGRFCTEPECGRPTIIHRATRIMWNRARCRARVTCPARAKPNAFLPSFPVGAH